MKNPSTLIEFDCASCRQTIRAPADLCGQVVACPSCQANLQLPAAVPPGIGRRGRAGKSRHSERPSRAALFPDRPLNAGEWLLMMWPFGVVLIRGLFFGGPRMFIQYEEASSVWDYMGKTAGPLLGISLFTGVSGAIIVMKQPAAIKILLTTIVGLAALLVWPAIGNTPSPR